MGLTLGVCLTDVPHVEPVVGGAGRPARDVVLLDEACADGLEEVLAEGATHEAVDDRVERAGKNMGSLRCLSNKIG